MSEEYVIVEKQELTDIADALRESTGGTETYSVSELSDAAVTSILSSGVNVPGENGATFIPNVSDDGIISWTNDKGLENPEPVNIKGVDGIDGIGISNIEKTDGTGAAGTVDTYTITMTDDSTYTFDVYNGRDGAVVDGEGNSNISVDATLTQSGMAADAKAAGDAIAAVKTVDVSDTEPNTDIWIDTSATDVINIPQINDSNVSAEDTWSSSKISSAISSMTSIDDTTTSETSTWSSSKIAEAINNMFSSLPNAEEASF